MILTPGFPSAPWDGTTPNRNSRMIEEPPDNRDWDRLLAEYLAVQASILTIKDASGNMPLTPLVTKGTDPAVITIADLFQITTKDIIIPVGSSAVASVDLGYSIPANSLVLAAAMNIETAITLSVATKIGLGISGTLNKYGSITGGTKNHKSTLSFATVVATADILAIYSTDNSGVAAGTIQNGSMRVRLVLATQAALPDAA